MFIRTYAFALLLFLLPLAYCFTSEEIEIFQLQNDLIRKYGEEIDFYKLLKLPKMKSSSSREIVKNLRILSKKYHPDKNKKYKKLYERLNLATQILSNESKRKTYDYYLKNGFPDYNFSKGGFYFKRIQPKTWFLFLFVFIAASVIHYAILWIQNTSNKKRIKDFITNCKENDDTNGLGEKRLMFKQHEYDQGKEFLVRFGEVFLIEEDGTQTIISPDTVSPPTIYDCMFFGLPRWFWNISIGKFFVKKKEMPSKKKGRKVGKRVAKPTLKKEPKIYEVSDEEAEKIKKSK